MTPPNLISADYPTLEAVASTFDEEHDRVQRVQESVSRHVNGLKNGGWISDAADSFYREMDDDLLPSLARLMSALGAAGDTTRRIIQIMREAEQEAAAAMKGTEGGAEQGSGMAAANGDVVLPLGLPGNPTGGGRGRSRRMRYRPLFQEETPEPTPEQTPEPTPTEPPLMGIGGTINDIVNTRTSPGISDNATGEQLEAGAQVTIIGVTYDVEDGSQWLLVETEDGPLWIAGNFADVDVTDLGDVEIYDNDGNLVPAEELSLRHAEAEILLRYGIDIQMYDDGQNDTFREPTMDDTQAVEGALADLEELDQYGVTLAPNGEGSTDEWTTQDIEQVHEGVIGQADGLYAFAQSNGFDVSGVTPGELYRDVSFEGNEITVYRNSAQESPDGYYGFVSNINNSITLYDAAFEGPLNVTGAADRPFTTQLLIQHEVQHRADFDHGSILTNNFSDLEDGSYQFHNEYTITYQASDGETQTYEIVTDPETGEMPTLAEVEADIGADVVNYDDAAYTGMDFVVASSRSAGELPIDVTVAVVIGAGFRFGENYSLEEIVGAAARQDLG